MLHGITTEDLCFRAAVLLILIAASAEDIREKRISLYFLLMGGSLTAWYLIYGSLWKGVVMTDMLTGFLPGMLMVALSFITAKGLGIGDGLMVFALGPVIGAENMCMALMLAFVLCALFSLILLSIKRISIKGRLAFLPFITAGVGVMCFAAV